ncbi:MAG: hypothetical protein ACRDYC_08555 [Acidimicrobiales bacterium]
MVRSTGLVEVVVVVTLPGGAVVVTGLGALELVDSEAAVVVDAWDSGAEVDAEGGGVEVVLDEEVVVGWAGGGEEARLEDPHPAAATAQARRSHDK